MRTILAFLLMVSVASATGIYTTTINDTPVTIEFVQGPFGPYEGGTATVTIDNVVYDTYSYQANVSDTIIVYDVAGFYTFIEISGKLNTYQDLNVTLYKK